VKPAAERRRKEYRARSHARRLVVQALYQLQVNPVSWQDAFAEIGSGADAERADADYFKVLLRDIADGREALDQRLTQWCEIPLPDLDPVEHATLWVGVHELQFCLDLPYRVVLAEAVELAKRFGATDGHKFVNGVLDRAAQELRAAEYGAGN
jgi:transcription antitermination protein NusB